MLRLQYAITGAFIWPACCDLQHIISIICRDLFNVSNIYRFCFPVELRVTHLLT
jgi:hypothetical protein